MATAALLRARAENARKLSEENENDTMSFGAAFNKAKAAGKPTFPWRGSTYTTETREERTQKAYGDTSRRREGEAAKAAQQADRAADARDTPTLRSLLGVAEPTSPTAQETMSRIASRPTSKSPEQERDEAKAKTLESLGLLATGGVGGLGRALAGRMVGRAASAPATTSRGALVRNTDDPPFKHGGSTKAYAKGGSVRGAGIAQRGVKKCKVY